ncbi:hypothetical protein F9L00_14315 [Brucella anthropi]|uniref:hypothetical protein n=1 Tax=Brucella TaxID=234 RepID=UPI00110E11E4|nr:MULTISPECIES: hypothetical protein [Brucella]KAB2776506.1 hypothetical protein F9L00_14315 [Brucella anthropi]TMV03091.1 hypothetical protein FGI60_11785 [Brucella haematophila]
MPFHLNSVPGPKHEGKYPDRNIDCQEAVAGAVVDIIEQAEKAGWTAVEAARAINDVSRGLFVGIQGKDPNE